MRPQEGGQILAELHPKPQVVRLWLFTRALPIALVLGCITIWAVGFSGAAYLSMRPEDQPMRATIMSPIWMVEWPLSADRFGRRPLPSRSTMAPSTRSEALFSPRCSSII